MALVATLLSGCTDSAVTADKSPRPVKAITLVAAVSTESVSLPALLVPIETANLSFRVAGPVNTINVSEGQPVTAGTALMALDPHDFQVQIAEYQARLVEAKAQARQAKQEQARVIRANAGDAIASVEIDRAKTAVERTAASVIIVEQRLQMMRDGLRYSVLKAPFDGVIASVDIEAHEQAVPAVDVVTIHGNSGFEIELDLPEKMATRISKGMSGQVILNGSEQPLKVVINEVSRSANMLTRTFTATARLLEQPLNGWPEQTGLLKIDLPLQQQSGFMVPSSAVQGESTSQYVVVVRDGVAQQIAVTVDGFSGELMQVHGALNSGDSLVVAGAPYFKHGDPVGAVLLGDRAAAL
ncbi:efflux RND transporter periplasmic adaptor subunit [Ferrimonas lipolytica]|uniref:Efflux RND transporter periplasmic adaptor subunit n=1 Tax=Ferrimonas lipolytica TaxID=2724191 RepID=A0A6H1UF07_9GAMM|nr:efflux RND transporter periplasmic adaptor subunit [Ferrimonas lipolytica]QIZ76923.1 efflux RND transporter periplasmic adaptor subunit [Ferrimonas lipolytica]